MSIVKRKGKFIVKAVISALLITILLSNVNIDDVFSNLENVKLEYLLLALMLQFVGSYLTSTRWKILLKTQGVIAPLKYLFKSWMVGCFFTQFLPSTIGSDAIRIYDSWRIGATKSEAVVVIAVDRLVGSVILILFAAIALLFVDHLVTKMPGLQYWVIGGAIFLLLALLWVFTTTVHDSRLFKAIKSFIPKKIKEKTEYIISVVTSYRGHHKALSGALLLSILLQLNVIVFYYILAIGMGFSIPFLHYFIIIPLVSFILLIPVSINGIGLREGAFIMFLSTYGLSAEQAIAYAWLSFFQFMAYGLLGGIVYAFRRSEIKDL